MTIPNVFSWLATSRLNLFQSQRKLCITTLPDDIFIDSIFLYLDVSDVLVLRQVNKSFYTLTHHPHYWKNLLLSLPLQCPLPLLPPTPQYTFPGLSGYDAERIAAQALTTDSNLRSQQPKIFRCRVLSTSQQNCISSIALLPGGHYMLASSAPPAGKFWRLTLYVMDYKGLGMVPVAEMRTGTKAYNLRAEYMEWKGEKGIMLCYTRRCVKDYINGVDPSDFHGENEVDSPVPLEHEICVMHLSLPALSSLLSEDIQWGSEAYYTRCNDLPSPFQWAARLNSREPIRCPTFETIKSRPWLVAIVGKERVVWKDLENGSVRWMRVPRWDRHPHFVQPIRVIKYIPAMSSLLAIREITGDRIRKLRRPVYSFEIYRYPRATAGMDQTEPYFRTPCQFEGGARATSIIVNPTPPPPTTFRALPMPAKTHTGPPPPISLYISLSDPESWAHIEFHPFRLRSSSTAPAGTAPRYGYSFSNTITQTHFDLSARPEYGSMVVLPGVQRAVVLTIPRGCRAASPPLVTLWSYRSPEGRAGLAPEHPDDAAWRAARDAGRPAARKEELAKLAVPEEVMARLAGGVACAAWDEGTGRVVLVPEGEAVVCVLEGAATPRLDDHGQRVPIAVPFR